MSEESRFIVAEVSKNWVEGLEAEPTGFLSQQFEHVINVNWQRGYKLVSFQVDRLLTGPAIVNETIIAVFEKVSEIPEDHGS